MPATYWDEVMHLFHNQPFAHQWAGRVSCAPKRSHLGWKGKQLLFRRAMSSMVGEGRFALATPALQLKPGLVLPACTPMEPE